MRLQAPFTPQPKRKACPLPRLYFRHASCTLITNSPRLYKLCTTSSAHVVPYNDGRDQYRFPSYRTSDVIVMQKCFSFSHCLILLTFPPTGPVRAGGVVLLVWPDSGYLVYQTLAAYDNPSTSFVLSVSSYSQHTTATPTHCCLAA